MSLNSLGRLVRHIRFRIYAAVIFPILHPREYALLRPYMSAEDDAEFALREAALRALVAADLAADEAMEAAWRDQCVADDEAEAAFRAELQEEPEEELPWEELEAPRQYAYEDELTAEEADELDKLFNSRFNR